MAESAANSSPPTTAKPVRLQPILLLVVLAVGILLRLQAATGDFWLDEIWSYHAALEAPSYATLLFAPHEDNTHPLNSLFIRKLGADLPWIYYRLLALAAGVGVLLLAPRLLGSAETPARSLSLALLAVNFPLIVYSSEARGYMPMLFFALCALLALRAQLAGPRAWLPPLFWAACIFGILSHLGFIGVYLALFGWSAAMLFRMRPAERPLHRLLALHALPLVVFTLFYGFSVRHMHVAGGPPHGPFAALLNLAGFAWGNAGSIPLACLFPATLVPALAALARRERENALLFLLLIVIVPLALIPLMPPAMFYERYFLTSLLFYTILLGWWLGRLMTAGRRSRLIALALVILFIGGHATSIANFISVGRGQYREAIDWLAADAPGPLLRVGSDQDFRNYEVLRYYARFLPPGRQLAYFARESWPPDGVDYFLVHHFDPATPAAPECFVLGHRFRFAAAFPHFGPSGFTWHVYRRAR